MGGVMVAFFSTVPEMGGSSLVHLWYGVWPCPQKLSFRVSLPPLTFSMPKHHGHFLLGAVFWASLSSLSLYLGLLCSSFLGF